MRRSLPASYIVVNCRLYSALAATPIATLPRYAPGGLDIGSIVEIYMRREIGIA